MDPRTIKVTFEDDGAVTFDNVTDAEVLFLVAHLPFLARVLAEKGQPMEPVDEE